MSIITIERWVGQVEDSYAHNSRLYEFLESEAGPERILEFLYWDAEQPPFSRFLEQWKGRAPPAILPALERHIDQEVQEDHSGLFRSMMATLAARYPGIRAEIDTSRLSDLNYTFSQECANRETFGFFCGSFLATEVMSAKRCQQLYRGLLKAGIPDSELKYLSLHALSDTEHTEEVRRDFLMPLLAEGGGAEEVEKGIVDRLNRSERYLRWYEKQFCS